MQFSPTTSDRSLTTFSAVSTSRRSGCLTSKELLGVVSKEEPQAVKYKMKKFEDNQTK